MPLPGAYILPGLPHDGGRTEQDMSTIEPGSRVSMEIVARPRTHAGRATLIRLCRKDPAVARHHRKQTAKRPSWETWRRGGMTWHHQMKTSLNFEATPGQRFTILASWDVLQDLASLKKCVKVTPA